MALPDSVKIYGDKTIVYGCADLVKSPTIGYVQSSSINSNKDEGTVEDEVGETVSHITSNKKYDMSFVVVVKGNYTEPKEDDICEMKDYKGIIVSIDRQWENKSAAKYTIKAKRFDKVNYDA
ncbi:MAG: hypothetical protein LBV12_06380 [Puniceicoccales bacterium]|jgi:uncharacterized protein YdeI (BOF family)|nr:hypothetical protein [Puniceicoccales bacterium]